jgi:uncharacterized pyridoxamine 5'-phosphate oxidase family protein
MYFIIEDKEQLDKLEMSDQAFIQVVTSNDYYHPKLTRVSLIYYNNSEKGYIFVINHEEGFSLNIKLVESFFQKHNKIYLLDSKLHSYFLDLPNSIDVQFICLDKNNEYSSFECNSNVHRDFYIKYPALPTINEIIPISKHYEKCQCLYQLVKDYFELEMDIELQNKLVDAYKHVEEAGIKIDLNCFHDKFTFQHKEYSLLGDKIYSYYNLYNLTARPTNSFNGVNFLAIPKDQDFRKCFIPQNDFLVEFDFDAYHLRLISGLIDFECPKESMHEYLGKLYFNTDKLTPEQYKESKSITFKQLYGGIEKQYQNIDFFKSLNEFIEQEWKKYNAHKALILPTGRILRKLPDMNKLKLFNYIVQNLETKENIFKILEINKLLSKKKTKLILITYDSFLFDFSQEDGKTMLKKIKTILEGKNMLVKHKYGSNYAF